MNKVNRDGSNFAREVACRSTVGKPPSRIMPNSNELANSLHPSNIVSSIATPGSIQKKKVAVLSSCNWVPDEEAQECKVCKASLWALRRKHHCRSCCYVFCGNCTRYRMPVMFHKRYQCTLKLCEGCYFKILDGYDDASVVLEAHSATQFRSSVRTFYAKELNLGQDQILFIHRRKIKGAHSEERRQIDAVRGSVIGMISNPDQTPVKSFAKVSPPLDIEGGLSYVTLAELITVPSDMHELSELLGISYSSLDYYIEVQRRCLQRLKIDSLPNAGEFILKTLIFLRKKVLLSPLVKFTNRASDYVKVKKVPYGKLADSEFYRGVAFTKTFPHKLMLHHTANPRILLISFPMDYAASIPGIVSINRDLHKEYNFKNSIIHVIKVLSPHIIFSTSSVPHDIIETFAKEDIQIMSNMKQNPIEKISDISEAPIIHSSSLLSSNTKLGSCSCFIMRSVPNSSKTISVISNETSIAPYFSIILKGYDSLHLTSLKQAIHYMIQVYCNITIESHLVRGVFDSNNVDTNLKRPYFDYPKPTEKHFLKAVISLGKQQPQILHPSYVLKRKGLNLTKNYSILRYCNSLGKIITDKDTLHKIMAKAHEFLVYRRTEHMNETFIVLTRHITKTSFCAPAQTVSIQIFGKGDYTIIGLIANSRSSSSELCQSPSCRQKLSEHMKYYISSNHMVIVFMRNVSRDNNSIHTKLHVECSKCELKTTPVVLPTYCLGYSFGRLMELYRYCTLFNSLHYVSMKDCKYHKDYSYVFTYKDTEVVIRHEPLKMYTLSLQTVTKPITEWKVTHTKPRSRFTIIREIHSYFIILISRAKEIFELMGVDQSKIGILRSFIIWIIKETEMIVHLVSEKLSSIKRTKHLRTGVYFGNLIAGRVRNCEAALAAFSGSLLGTNEIDTAEEKMLRIEHLLHIDNKYNPLAENSIFKLRISAKSVLFTLDTIPYNRWSCEYGKVSESKLSNNYHGGRLSTASDYEGNNIIDSSEPATFSEEDTLNERRGRMLLEVTRIPQILATPRESESSSIIAFALNSEHYSVALSKILLQSHITPKISSPRIKYSSSIPSLTKNGIENWKCASHLNHELEHITYEENINNLYIRCKVMYAAAFNSLRRTLGEDKYYVPSLFRCYNWNKAGGKSDSRFFKTADGRYVLKEVSRFEQCTLREVMPKYIEYISSAVINERPTLLSVPLGAYSIHCSGPSGQVQKIDLIVTQNMFYNRDVSKIFDLKGSTRARRALPTNGCGEVLMDENYLECRETPPTMIHNHEREFIRAAVWNDTEFLSGLNVMDYSLAVGISKDKTQITVGILDYMRTFTWDKKLENWVKESSTLLNSKRTEPTIVSPNQYGVRFRRAINDYFKAPPDEYSELEDKDILVTEEP